MRLAPRQAPANGKCFRLVLLRAGITDAAPAPLCLPGRCKSAPRYWFCRGGEKIAGPLPAAPGLPRAVRTFARVVAWRVSVQWAYGRSAEANRFGLLRPPC